MRWRVRLALLFSAPLFAGAFVIWRASHAKEEAVREVHANSELPFRVLPVDRPLLPAVDSIQAAPEFRDIAVYKETIAVTARAGLFLYDRNGALLRSYRSGMELPPAELAGMSVGIGAGSAAPELFIATRGAGLLAFDGTRFRQILPHDASSRNVTAVLVLASGRVLLGTERHGVLAFDGQRLVALNARLKDLHITALAGSESDLWIGTLDAGVFHSHAGQLEQFQAELPDPQVLSLAAGDGPAYVGTPLGVVEFQGGRPVRTVARGFLALAVSPCGDGLLVGTEDEGILNLTLQSRPVAHVRPAENGPSGPIHRLATLEGTPYAVGPTPSTASNPRPGAGAPC